MMRGRYYCGKLSTLAYRISTNDIDKKGEHIVAIRSKSGTCITRYQSYQWRANFACEIDSKRMSFVIPNHFDLQVPREGHRCV